MDKAIAILLILFAAAISSIGVLFLKLGSVNAGKIALSIKGLLKLANHNIILGIACYFIASMIFIFTLKTQELSFLFPLTALNYFFVTFLSIRYLKERLNKYKIGGILLVLIGVAVLSI